jgi:hypothetical protein
VQRLESLGAALVKDTHRIDDGVDAVEPQRLPQCIGAAGEIDRHGIPCARCRAALRFDDGVPTVAQHADQARADEPRSAGYEHAHSRSLTS